MKNLSKRMISLLLSILMIATMIPTFTVFAEEQQISTKWTEIASTDFTAPSWYKQSNSFNYNYTKATGFKGLNNDTENFVSWEGYEHWQDERTEYPDGWNRFYTDSTHGTKIRNGFMYMTGWNKNGVAQSDTPITGKSSFKIDVEFSFFGDYTLESDWKKNVFLKLKNDDYTTEKYAWENVFFAQMGYGGMYTPGNGENAPSIKRDSSTASMKTNYFRIASNNELIGKDNNCHYILEYAHHVIRAYITDSSGNIIINYGSVDYADDIDTSTIKGVQLAASCGGEDRYYKYIAYKSIKFYEGTETNYSPEKQNTNDKYLYAYFTGNSDAGEKLRYAVSDDGYNWESLNGANAVADAHDIASTLSVYPSGARTGLGATGNVRDPYILYAQDGTYYVLATDLDTDTYGFNNNAKFLVWHVNSLADIDTATPWCIDTTSLMADYMGDGCLIDRAWAPEAVYDYEEGKYMLVFASSDTSDTYGTRMFYVYTSDFKTFDGNAKLLLPHVSGNNIDGNITYADGLYYLWYKDETGSKIGYSTAEHANGPYGTVHEFYDDRLSSVFEGPEVYYNTQAGKYILIADNFGGGSYMAAYQNNSVGGFSASDKLTDGTAYNMTHMSPRHGFITRISTADYNALIAKYGRDVWDVSNVDNGHKAKEYLIARYFTTQNSTADASGHNNNLDSSNAVMGTISDRYAANFSGSKVAKKQIASMLSSEGINAKDGITFDWWGYSTADEQGRFFDMASVEPGTVVWDGSGNNQKNSNYIYASEKVEFGSYYGNGSGRTGASKSYTDTENEWHRYTMVLSKGWIDFYIDGELYGYTIGFTNTSGATIGANTPLSCGDGFSDTVLNSMVNLTFGDSSWRDDPDFGGAISDFRIYNRALTFADVESSDSVISTASYLTDEGSFNGIISSGLATKTGEVTWDSTENAAYFNGGYLTVNENPLETATNSSGFTISFDFKRTNGSENMSRIIDINDGTTSNTFAINGGAYSGTEWNRLRTLAKVNGTECNYYANDLWNGSYCTYTTSAICTETPNDWHNLTVVMDADGYYSYYYDGVLRGTFRNDYGTAISGSDLGNNVTASQIKNQMVVMTQVNIGKSIYNVDPTFKGYIKNVHIVAQDVNASLSKDAKIEDAISFAQAKMTINNYKNTYNTYKAYYNACEAIDAAKYGNDNSKLDSSKAALINAVNNMSKWSRTEYVGNNYGYTASGSRIYENDSRDGLANYVKLAYCEKGITPNNKSGYIDITSNNNYYWGGDVYYPEVTMIYDGFDTKPQTTTLISLGGTKGKSRYVIGATLENGNGLALTDNWHGDRDGIGNLDFNWGWDTRGTFLVNGTAQTSGEYLGKGKDLCLAWNNGSRYIRFVNRIQFTGSMNDDEAYRAITPTIHVYMNSSDSYRESIDATSRTIPCSKNIRVVNYKRIGDTILDSSNQSKVNTASHLGDYKEGNAAGVFRNLDVLTSWDNSAVNSYFASSNGWDSLQSAITGDLAGMNTSAATKDTRAAVYQSLRESITATKSISGNTYSVVDAYQDGTDSMGFTTSSYNTFKNAYVAAKNMFAALNDNDNESGYSKTSKTDLETLNTNLSTAFANLELKADFRALDAAKASWITYANSSDVTSAYTRSSIQALKDYVANTTEFPYENAADRNDTGVSKNSEIAAEIAKYDSINAGSILDPLADLTYLDATYDKANTFLTNLDGKAAQYTAASMQALIDSVNKNTVSSGTDNTAEDISTANAAARADFGQAVQSDANALADGINTAMTNLKKADTVVAEGVDTSAFEAAVIKINNLDPDAYNVSSGSISSAIAGVNAVMSSDETQETYGTATINVLNNSITQENVEDATNAILNALTVSTKTYKIIKDADGSTDFTVASKTGTYYESDSDAPYGTTIVANSGNAETAWYLEIETNSMHKKSAYAGYGQRLQAKVLGETTIKAVKRADGQKKVRILRQYGDEAVTDRSPVQEITFVDNNSSYTLKSAPAIAFYEFDGYYVGGNKVTGSVTITDDTDIIAKYTASNASCAINATALDGGTSKSTTVNYNDKVELEGGATAYAWVEAVDSLESGRHYRPFYIGADVSFFASESTELMAVTEAQFNAYKFALPCVNLRQSGVVKEGTKTIFNAQLVPNGVDVQEYGILIGAPSSKNGHTAITPSATQVVIENSGQQEGYAVLRAKSTKLVGANQFTIGVNNLPDGYIYRGYMIYKDSKGNLHNVYSEAMQ
ncbi:MAG: hypothetical protein IJR70_03045 [Eubacterium sp.]|nr:hypothetical protein [Eubacterium sp.]